MCCALVWLLLFKGRLDESKPPDRRKYRVNLVPRSSGSAQCLASRWHWASSPVQCLACGRHSGAQIGPVPGHRLALRCPVPGLRPDLGLQSQCQLALSASWLNSPPKKKARVAAGDGTPE